MKIAADSMFIIMFDVDFCMRLGVDWKFIISKWHSKYRFGKWFCFYFCFVFTIKYAFALLVICVLFCCIRAILCAMCRILIIRFIEVDAIFFSCLYQPQIACMDVHWSQLYVCCCVVVLFFFQPSSNAWFPFFIHLNVWWQR